MNRRDEILTVLRDGSGQLLDDVADRLASIRPGGARPVLPAPIIRDPEADQMREQLGAALDLHRPKRFAGDTYCDVCIGYTWPCPTARTLGVEVTDGTE